MWFSSEKVVVGGAIEVCDQLTSAKFARLVAARAPAIIRSFVDPKSIAFAQEANLVGASDDVSCNVYVSRDGQFPGGEGPYDETRYRRAKMSLAECRSRITNAASWKPLFWPNERYYLVSGMPQLMTEIRDSIQLPEFIPYKDSPGTNNVWMSQPGNLTPPHLDFYENILIQVTGKKELLLWDAAQAPQLYLNRFGHPHSRQSAVDVLDPDLTQFPLFADAHALSGELRTGDALYIPFDYIHCIYSVEFSISINYWWGGPAYRLWRALRSPAMSHFARPPGPLFKHLLSLLIPQALRRR